MDGPPVQDAVHQLEELIQAVNELRRRVDTLEQRSVVAAPSGRTLPALSVSPKPLPEVSSGLLAQLGRLLLGIAGAYLLRAVTEAGILPQITGAVVGLLYAGTWLVASIYTASNRVSLALEGLTASAIAAPLLWEATTRFHAISPSGAAAALAFFIALGQMVGWKRDHDAIAAITAAAGSITAVALIIATLDPVPFAIAFVVVAAVVEYGAIRDHALTWRWITALAADFCAFLLVYLLARPQGLPEGYAPVPVAAMIGVQIALVAVYLASTTTRTLVRRLRIAWSEILQLAAVVSFVVVSNLRVAHGVGAGMIAAAAACYLAALSGTTCPLRRNFRAYATFGVILLIAGSFLLLPGPTSVALWSVLALGAIWFGERQDKLTFWIHGVIYLLAAAAVSFKLAVPWPPALAAVLAYGLMLWIASSKGEAMIQRLPMGVVAGLLVGSAYGTVNAGLARSHLDASFVATFGTVLISLIAIALGWFGKRWNRTELIWILYPWMTFGALKLIVEDFQRGRSATLFLSLLVYGGTLIAVPPLLREAKEQSSDLSLEKDPP